MPRAVGCQSRVQLGANGQASHRLLRTASAFAVPATAHLVLAQVRLDTLLPELSPHDRGAELVEHTVRQHVSLCFAALERRLLATAEALAAALAAPDCRHNGAAKQRAMEQGLAVLQALLVQGVERLLRRCAWADACTSRPGSALQCSLCLLW